ncbi:MAG: N-acetylmuramoyl-L-alanine amidase [Saprospiraceae bacterium]|nr:N-acetylmuramoyl-L-alanine amidase [Saprospiraceae bacterium]MCB9323724.1 N-acetylmuramoyl-L-alanine amidase [Lewinellaceae bacterium]
MKRLLLPFWLLFLPLFLIAEEAEYFQVKAMRGDGIYSLLRRYELDKNSCNFDRFYELNQLKKNAALKAGKNYFVPILLFSFNGRTIRSSIGRDDWDLAVTIQEYNERMHEERLRETSFKEDKILWVPYHLLNCPISNLDIPPPVSKEPELGIVEEGNRKYPIFGVNYAYTPLESSKLKGKVYYVVSGHGGPDPGAMGKRGNYTLCEDEYAYDVALRLCRHLIANGATAYMITRDPDDGIRDEKYLNCDTDELLWGDVKMDNSQKTRLFQRSDIINDLYEKHRLQGVTEQRAIFIHVDSRSKRERTDLFFYHKSGSEEGKTLASNMQKTIKEKYKKYRDGGHYLGTVSSRDLHMLREVTPVSVYVELANIRNTFDQQRIVEGSNRKLLADWLFEGLMK